MVPRGNGAQYTIVQRRAPPPCNIVNQEQSDKRVRSWPGRGPQGGEVTIPFTCSGVRVARVTVVHWAREVT